MASPMDTFKNNLFDQLKSYGDAVQDAFEQRIARPLLAFKRDLSRPSSAVRTSSEQESVLRSEKTAFITQQESVSSSSSPLDIIDIETSSSLKTILNRVKNTLSPSTKRRTSEDFPIDDIRRPPGECRHSSISSVSNRNPRRNILRHHKSVSFADNNIQYDGDTDRNNPYSTDDRNESVRNVYTLAHPVVMASIDEMTTNQINPTDISSTVENNDCDFERNFRESIRPRRISIGNSQDLIYQDLSAEIVSYVLKHALRVLEKEDEDSLLTENEKVINKNEYNEDLIDLK
ncbi:unnamed protein product [Rotaria sp. Silwood1]|nr:unnamed protein product [Rotaria sp. Silwood1]CAF0997375.1 unnamed protein product [Rotaria sp. Silwood1]CAF3385170.1 unnamed protein product [Rotaria sp. Silwood1]CAF3407040.1 unnamed protein product [Rotaria sp. Silwood1]CAF3407131.1 unnamed protein product [Rotaria sp. Silwood1]